MVGLGKTIVACQIAKKFFFSNGYPVHIGRTLIIVPPAVRDSWIETIAKFQLHNVDIVSNGSLHKVRHPDRYNLVIVDEAHKFRNDSAGMYDQLQRICKTKVRNNSDNRLEPKKVMLISATPLNNSPKDIYNLLLHFQDGKETTRDIANLQGFFAERMDEWKAARGTKGTGVYKGTVYFIKRWVPRISRTTDQMEQAARSGKQNIVEGSLASAVSKETEVKLTGVALASLGELLEDYRDFLYVRDLAEWTPEHPYARRLSQLCRTWGACKRVRPLDQGGGVCTL